MDTKVYQFASLEDKIILSTRKWSQTLIAISICYICISAGNLVGYTSFAIPSIKEGNPNHFFNTEKSTQIELMNINLSSFETIGLIDVPMHCEFASLTDSQASWIGGLAPLGAFLGCLSATIAIKYLGPKGTVQFSSGPVFLISWILMAFAPSIQWIYVSRIIGGLAMGLTFSAVPIYIVETASVELRGPLGTLPQFIFTIGVLVSFICGSCLDWRMTAFTSALIVLPVFLILPFIPESPLWLMSKNRFDEGESSCKRIHGISHGSTEYQKLKEQFCTDINQNTQMKKKETIRFYFQFLRSPSTRRSTLVAIFLCVFQQLSGINGVNFYTVTIFEAATTGPNSILDEHTSAIIVASVFCLANLCSYILIEKLGRKFLLILSTTLMSLSAFSLGFYFYMLESGFDTEHLIFIPLASLITFVLAFSIGYGPLLYVIVAEILSSDIRSVVSPVAVGINWLCVFIVAKSFPGLITEIGASGTFWLYGSLSIVSLVFTFLYVPETKGKCEDEIQRFFGRPRHSQNGEKFNVKFEKEVILEKISEILV